jgi:hypothetical protein
MNDPGYSQPELLEQEPPPGRKVPRPVVIGVATALVIATGVSVAAASAGSPAPVSPSPVPTASAEPVPTASAEPAPSERVGPPIKIWGHGRMFGGIHGEFVVPKEGGGFQTVATQTGEVTAVDGDSITVKSEDDFSKTYTVNDATRVSAGREGITAVKTGDTVMVTATVEGETATATMVIDMTRPAWGKLHRGGNEKFFWTPRRPREVPVPSVEPSSPESPSEPTVTETVSPTA